MVDQLTICERIANTPIPKSCVYASVFLSFILGELILFRWYTPEAVRYSLPIRTPFHFDPNVGMGHGTW